MHKNFQGKLLVSYYTNSIKGLHPYKVAQDLIIILVESQHLEGVSIEVNIWHKPLLKTNKSILFLIRLHDETILKCPGGYGSGVDE
jgi:hypothetical protein